MTEPNETVTETPGRERRAEFMAPVRRFRMLTVRYSLLTIAIGAIVAYRYSVVACHGILLGGLGGVLGFWLMARGIEKFATIAPSRVKFEVYTGTFTRLIIYGLVLGKAYTLDREGMVGFLGAVGGILVVRFVTLVLGVTSLDLRSERPR